MSPQRMFSLVVLLLAGCADRRPPQPPPDNMVRVPAGAFISGCDPTQVPTCAYGLPLQTRVVSAFEIDRTEVAIGDYLRCYDAGPCRAAAERVLADADRRGMSSDDPRPVSRRNNKRRPDDRLPMFDVTPEEARAYCGWAGKRLPTELEWEKAARGVDGRPYPWGWELPSCERAVYNDCRGPYWSSTTDAKPVGSVPAGASPYGVLDMVGNVFELAEPAEPVGADAVSIGPVAVVPLRANPLSMVLGRSRALVSSLERTSDARDQGFRCARSVEP